MKFFRSVDDINRPPGATLFGRLWIPASNVVALAVELYPPAMHNPWLVTAQLRAPVKPRPWTDNAVQAQVVVGAFPDEEHAIGWVRAVLEDLDEG